MRQQGLQPDAFSYTAVLSACGKGWMPERALQLLGQVQRQGLQPNAFTYSAVISACGKDWMQERA